MRLRVSILLGAVFVTTIAVFLFPPIPQSEAYHNFADTRAFFGIPNCLNVISNALFLVVGLWGMWFVLRCAAKDTAFVDSRERWAYFLFFVGVALTSFGSSWYHLHPNDHTLVWDRIPMTIGFTALVAAVVAERISVKAGLWLLAPLVAAGVGTVLYWNFTQSNGHGDLRPYAVAQFGSLLVLLLIIIMFPPRYTCTSDLGISLALYALAKILETADRPIFSLGGIVSGHTLKHIAAAVSAYWILRMLQLRTPIRREIT